LETGDIEKIGSTRSHKVDVRVLAATNKNLEDLVAKGEFRSDLYYRLKVVEIRMPPLRERQEDIPLLVEYFVARTSRELNREKPVVTREAVELLQSHSWPGNVRELENLVKNCLVRLRGNVLHPEDVMPFLQKAPPVLSVTEQDFRKVPAESVSQTPLIFKREYIQALFDNILANQPLPEGLDAFDLIERELLEMALRYCRGNKSKAAKLLGISRNTVRKRVTKYGFDSVAEEE
jgi:DNA-binding NtrC family response regulator